MRQVGLFQPVLPLLLSRSVTVGESKGLAEILAPEPGREEPKPAEPRKQRTWLQEQVLPKKVSAQAGRLRM